MQQVRAKKFLGQHFLKDLSVAQRIAETITEGRVLEIGPGMGVLTQFLLKNPNLQTTAIEIDRESVVYLKEWYPELHLIEGDFLKLDLNIIYPEGEFCVIGNYPYNISSQIFFKVLDHKDRIPVCSGMIQKEVAERIASKPGKKAYGILSVLLQAYYDIEYLFTVDEHVFNPPPKVKSAVIRMTRNNRQGLGCDEALFKNVVKTAFNQRRKQMRNSLMGLVGKENPILNDPIFTKRPEQLSVEEFISLTQKIDESLKTRVMAELKIFYKDKDKDKIKVGRSVNILTSLDKSDIIWIDLLDVSDRTEGVLEDFLKIDIQEDDEMEEIEMSSRYIQTDDSIVANSNFLRDNFEVEPVNFILKNSILVTTRDVELASFNETVKKMLMNTRNFPTGYHVLVTLMETRVERDADMIEDTTDLITKLSGEINAKDHVDEEVLIQIKDLQEKVTIIRQNIMDKQRVISNFLKCDFFPTELQPRLTMIIKDINSLFDYTRFGFDRLDYLQDTFLGLVNIEQNKIIKIFTVVNVVFLPPTLIASMYGMNFDFMPELGWKLGYPFAIGLMIVFTVAILLIFKWKKWL